MFTVVASQSRSRGLFSGSPSLFFRRGVSTCTTAMQIPAPVIAASLLFAPAASCVFLHAALLPSWDASRLPPESRASSWRDGCARMLAVCSASPFLRDWQRLCRTKPVYCRLRRAGQTLPQYGCSAVVSGSGPGRGNMARGPGRSTLFAGCTTFVRGCPAGQPQPQPLLYEYRTQLFSCMQ